MKKVYIIIFILFIAFTGGTGFSQENKKTVSEMTKEELSELSYQDLMNLPLEDLMVVANKFGLSADEILEYFLNKDVTSASKRAEKSINSPLSTTVLSRDEIISSGATSIPEALRLIPGMIIREKTTGNYDAHIRGNDNLPPKNMFIYSENSISLVMIDGRPVYNYAFGGSFWETLPVELNDIDRIEVIRGPSSALYGPNAVSGVVNIITLKPEGKKLKTDAGVQIGNNSAKLANASLAFGVSDKLKVRLSGNYTHFNRSTDDFYVYDLGRSFSKSEMDTMHMWYNSSRSKMPVHEKFDEAIPDPSLSLDKYGVNAFIFYDLTKDINFNLSAGLNNANNNTTTLGNSEFPIAGRDADFKYFDIRSKIYGFSLQANYMMGTQDFQRASKGWDIDPQIANASLEYEKSFGSFVIRPGISYQSAIYDDTKSLTQEDITKLQGFLNGAPKITNVAGYIRGDYSFKEKLRLIAALRADKYNVPNSTYFTYQFISTYNINPRNLVRFVYSRANRGPFIVDSYANYNWQVVPTNSDGMTPQLLKWNGSKKLDLPVMDMFELGFRTQPFKNIMIDIEAFQSKTKHFSYFVPDTLDVTLNLATGKAVNSVAHIQYYNFDLASTQTGLTFNISAVVTKNLNVKVFGTFQKTDLENVYPKNYFNNLTEMQASIPSNPKLQQDGYLLTVAMRAQAAQAKLLAGLTPTTEELQAAQLFQTFNATQLGRIGQLQSQGYQETYQVYNTDIENGKIKNSMLEDSGNKATPSFYGGFSVSYSPTNKLNAYLSSYFFTSNEIIHSETDDTNSKGYDPIYKIDAKAIFSLKLSYKVYKENTIFINCRNLFNSSSREFAFMDKVYGKYLVGASISF